MNIVNPLPEVAVERLIPHVANRLCELFATDELPEGFTLRLRSYVDLSVREAAYVQCVGMREPIPLVRLYQPTRFKDRGSALDWISSGEAEDAVVFAGPGQGKTTFLRFVLLTPAYAERSPLILLTLRTEGTLELLATLVDILEERRRLHRVPASPLKALLLVDGYDEINEERRRQVAALLKRFSGLRGGHFILACRTAYTVDATLLAKEFFLADFDTDDAVRFVDAFSASFGLQLSGVELVRELERRQLTYIATHPLMLTLACVVKSRANPELPPNGVELLRQAIEVLTFRWDEARGIVRSTGSGLPSVDILQCVMRIAYDMETPKVPITNVIETVKRYLALKRRTDVYPEKVIDDMRRFFGLLVISPDGQCQFVHKTLHDYLAARYEVEGGLFQPGRVQKWDTRAAYATCLVHDATQSIHMALTNSRSVEAVCESLLNGARFDADVVATAVFTHFDVFRVYIHATSSEGNRRVLSVSTDSDFFGITDDVFLLAILRKSTLMKHTTGHEVVVAFCIAELRKRELALPPEVRDHVKGIFASVDVLQVRRSGRQYDILMSEVVA